MKSLSRILSAAGLDVGAGPDRRCSRQRSRKTRPRRRRLTPLKAGSPAAIAAAKEILTMKNAAAMSPTPFPISSSRPRTC